MTREESEIFNDFQSILINSLNFDERLIYETLVLKFHSFPFLENNVDNLNLLVSFQEILDNKVPQILRQMAESYLVEEKEILSNEEYEIVVKEEMKYLEDKIFEANDFT